MAVQEKAFQEKAVQEKAFQEKTFQDPASLQIEFAPMEGVTGYIYRNAHHKYFGGVDRYYTPFLSPNLNHRFSFREMNDVLPENNPGIRVIPQILTNRAEDFLWAAQNLKEMGYGEVNLNLGCPSGTVAAKGKGAGFLGRRRELDVFLETIFREAEPDISVKTRIGKDSPEEFAELLQIFNKYPIKELIIHPRVQKDFYKNSPRWEVFADAVRLSRNPVCYNGDLFRAEDYERFHEAFPEMNAVMLGRGAAANPALPKILRNRAAESQASAGIVRQEAFEMGTFRLFYEEIYSGYRGMLSGERNVLFKMKELWAYWFCLFPDQEKYAKKIRKAAKTADYEAAVKLLFSEGEFDPEGGIV